MSLTLGLILLVILDQLMQPEKPRSWTKATLIFVIFPISVIAFAIWI